MKKQSTVKAEQLRYFTRDYDLFVYDPHNRVTGSHPRLRESMEKFGWDKTKPISVKKDPKSKKLLIRDGQHRYATARDLDIGIWYAYDDGSIPIPVLNNAQKAWSIRDYANCFERQGNMEYKWLNLWSSDKKIQLSVAVRLLSTKGMDGFKEGQFKRDNEDFANEVSAVIETAKKHARWAAESKFVTAIANVLSLSKATSRQLIEKLNAHGSKMLHQCAFIEEYVAQIEKIYNHQVRVEKQIPIAQPVSAGLQKLRNGNLKNGKDNGEKH